MIEIKNVSFDYSGKKALSDISFDIKQGEKVIILGVNGCGKSTLLKVLDGLIFPNQGEYFYKGNKIEKSSLHKKQFNQMFRTEVVLQFQNPEVMLFNPTVFDEIAFGLRQLGIENIEEKVKHWAERFGISGILNAPPFQLSGGEKQKICLASLFVLEPEVILLDEPTSNLDPKTTGWFVDFLYEINKTIIISTHNLSLATELGERGIILSPDHKIIYDGNINRIFEDDNILLEANLMHTHTHRKNESSQKTYHIHNWY